MKIHVCQADPSIEEFSLASRRPESELTNEAVNGEVHVVREEVEKEFVPPNGACFAWIIVLASAVAHVIIGGLERSGGILYVELLERYESSAAATAWVTSLGSGFRLFCGPLASAITDRVGFRLVVLIGSLTLTVGCILSAFPPQLFYVHLSFGLLGGLGCGLCYTPSVVIVGLYFDKKRGMAVGLATAGVGVGSFVLPPLLRFLFDDLGYQGTFIILGGITLQLCVCAMFYHNPTGAKTPRFSVMEIGVNKKKIDSEGKEINIKYVQDSFGSHIVRLNEIEDGSENNSKNINKDEDVQAAYFPDSRIPKKQRRWIRLGLLKDTLFLAFCLTIGLMTTAFQVVLAFLPALAESKGLTKTESALLLSIMGVIDTVSRVVSGVLFDADKIRPRRRYLYNGILFVLAVVIFFFPLAKSFASFSVMSLLIGVLSGAYISQKSVIIVDLLGTEALVASFGILVWFEGVGTFIGPPLAGQFRDIYQNYDLAFQFGGGITLLAGLIFSVSNLYFLLQNRKVAGKTGHIKL